MGDTFFKWAELLLKYLASWPVIALVIAIRFEKPIRDLLPRLRRFGQAELDPMAAQPIEASGKTPSIEIPIEKAPTPGAPLYAITPELAPFVPKVDQYLAANPIPQGKEREFIRHGTALALRQVHYTRVARFIFGSQLNALNFLHSASGAIPLGQIAPFYQRATRRFREIYRNSSFDRWLLFLISNELVTNQQGSVAITDIGRGFLVFLQETRDTGQRRG